ncbi:Nucleoid-associated protein [Trichinella spiralis]|uniref:Nucleoid-associated protein n=1 Tax=Trichinella spiralis TaxID=6334 RepID=A0ABR3KYA8_TRISP
MWLSVSESAANGGGLARMRPPVLLSYITYATRFDYHHRPVDRPSDRSFIGQILTLELNTPLDQGHLSADHSDNDLLPSVSTLRTTAG